MARLPSERYLIQQIDGQVVLFEDGTEREIVRFDPTDANATARAQRAIFLSELNAEDKCFAHFWSGYFHAHAGTVSFSDPKAFVYSGIDTTHLHEHDQDRALDKTFESRLH